MTMTTQMSINTEWIGQSTSEGANEAQSFVWEELRLSDPINEGWMTRIIAEVYKHPQVEALYVSIDDREPLVDYWIVIERRDISLVRSLIEDQQKNIVNLFAQTAHPPFQLDFHICYREGRDAGSLVPDNSIYIPRF